MILFLKFQPQRVIISRTILTIYRRVERGEEALSLLLQIEIWLANIANFWDYFMGFLKVSDVKENSALLAWHLKQSRHMASDKKKSNASVGCFTWLPIQSNSFLDALVPSISCKWLSLKAAACSEKLFQRFKNICWFRVLVVSDLEEIGRNLYWAWVGPTSWTIMTFRLLKHQYHDHDKVRRREPCLQNNIYSSSWVEIISGDQQNYI